MCGYKDDIKYILENFSDEEAVDKLKEETLKEDMILAIQDASMGITLDKLGITIDDVNNIDYMHGIEDADKNGLDEVNMDSTRLVKLYRYVSTKRAKSTSSRRFCRELMKRTDLAMLRKEDIDNLNSRNPGLGKGGSNNYSVFNWRGGVNCQHIWVKYLYNPDTKNLVKAPSDNQPIQRSKGKVPNA